jgi:nucleoside permease NupC
MGQVPANHLISASVMAAPAALAMSKLFYPETRKSRAGNEVYNIPSGYIAKFFSLWHFT